MTAAALATGAATLAAQPGGRIDVSRMRPTGLLVDSYSYMTPPHNRYYFHHIDRLGFRLERVRKAGPPSRLMTRAAPPPPIRYRFREEERSLEDYLARTDVTGFLVLRRDTVVLERYFHGASPRSRFVSQSVGKSILSILVGVAVDEGRIAIADPVTRYLPELAGTGYDGATVKNVLQMATGVGYSEDYRDSTSGAARIGAALLTGMPAFSAFVRSMKPTPVAPGTAFEYQSVNTQVLAMLLERVTGERLSEWTERRLWRPLGAEADGFYYQARAQPETCAFACFNATLRDYGRLGLLMLGGGSIDGRRIVSEAWVRQSTTADEEYLKPVREAGRPPRMGYGFQWWLPPWPEGAFMAIGIFGQAIYVDPGREVVIVQTAAWPEPVSPGLGAERAAVFQAVAAAVAGRY